jgi:restriction system protein
LHAASFLEAADQMSGTAFERYVGDLLRNDGCSEVTVGGGTGDGGTDMLATEPSRRPVAIQCKRQFAPIAVGVVRQLLGSVSVDAGRASMLLTTAMLTGPAWELARRSGATVVDRPRLEWMATGRPDGSGGSAPGRVAS